MAAFDVNEKRKKKKMVIVIALANAQNRILAMNVLAIRTHAAARRERDRVAQ